MRLAFVVQRYGLEIRGGAELHCRLIAELLTPHHDVEVITTCATNYVTWENEYPAGISSVNNVPVWRFPVRRPRNPDHFGRLQERVFHRKHSEQDALAWLDAQGPYSPKMRNWIEQHTDRFDYWICFSYRYWTTFFAMRATAGRAIVVPTAEPDPTIDLPIFHPLFREARAIVYNSHEERDMILDRSGADDVPSDIVGVGIQEPMNAAGDGHDVDPDRFRRHFDIDEPFMLYVGRIDENKGCKQLFEFHERLARRAEQRGERAPLLVLAGNAILPIPERPSVRHIGMVSEQEKWDGLAAASFLAMPSFYESLSMVLLEAWALSKPVLVNTHCDVLRGQVERSSGGLYYADGEEFIKAAELLFADDRLRQACGAAGHKYFADNYRWPVIERKYEAILQSLQS